MATLVKIKYKQQKDHLPSVMKSVLTYCLQPEKTHVDESAWTVNGQNCTPETAYQEFMANKAVWQKTDGLYFRHYVQSFHPDEKISPELANQIGMEFAARAWQGYAVVVATHTDRDHIHNHFIIDTVNVENGKKLHEDRRNMERLRKLNDEVCAEHHLSVLTPYANGQVNSISAREYRSGRKRESWKFRLRAAIKYAMEHCGTQNEFILLMKKMGYGVRWERDRKNITYTCLKEPKYKNGVYRKCNDDKLSDEKYLKEIMEYEFRKRQEILAGRDDGHVRPERGRNAKRGSHGRVDGGRMGMPDGNHLPNGSDDGRAGNAQSQAPLGNRSKVRTNEELGKQPEQRNAGTHQNSTSTDRTGVQANASGTRKTGWEAERGIYFYGSANGQTRKGNVLDKSSRIAVFPLRGVLLAGAAGLISTMGAGNDGKTPEEIQAEERARLAGENVAATLELIKLGVELAQRTDGEESVSEPTIKL